MPAERPIIIATRGSTLALAQANTIAAQGRAAFPKLQFELKIVRTTGDKLQTVSMTRTDPSLPKGLFTKELEEALLNGEADLAVHSLKDLPTELPAGLFLAATPERGDARDVLIYREPGPVARGFPPHAQLKDFAPGAVIATSSTRRKVTLLAARPDLKIVEMRGNVPTRLQKVVGHSEFDATILALAGLTRLHYKIRTDGKLAGDAVPDGLLATVFDLETMLPCVGQGAIGIEIRTQDERIASICERLNHFNTFQCVTAERAFLRAMGGGCQSPVAAYAQVIDDQISMRAVSFHHEIVRRGAGKRPLMEPSMLGAELAAQLK